jgi:hypothetical protein
MLSFPASLTNEIAKDSSDLKYLVKLERRLIASPYTTSFIYFSNDDCTVYDDDESEDVTVFGSLQSDIKISERIDIKTHVSSVGGFSIKLIDLGHANVSDIFATHDIFNRPVEIFLLDKTNDTSNGSLLYKGICGVPTYTQNSITLPIENSTSNVNLELGQDKITEADKVVADPPSKSLGKSKPIVYGDHVTNINNTTVANANFSKKTNLVPCIDMGEHKTASQSFSNWYVAGHECKSIDELWVNDTDVNDLAQIKTFTTVTNDSTKCVIQHETLGSRYLYMYPSGTFINKEENGATVTNANNVLDFDLTTFASLSAQDVENVGQVKKAELDIQFFSDPFGFFEGNFTNSSITAIKFYVRLNYSHQGSSGNEEVKIIDFGSFFGTNIDIRGYTNDTIFNEVTPSSTNRPGPTVRFRVHSGYEGDTFPTRILKIYGCYLRVEYTPLSRGDVFFGGTGRKDDGSGTVTGSADSLIENPSHVAEDIARNYMSLSSNINTTSFDNVNSELTANYKLSFFVDSPINSKSLLEKIGFQSKSFFRFDSQNKISADTFFASPSADIDSITLDEIINIKFSKISLKDLVNKLFLNYFFDSNENVKQLTRSYDTANTGSQARYNVVNEKVIDADFIRTDTTAGLLADHWVKDSSDSFWSLPRNIIDVEFITSRKNFLALEVSDVIQFDHNSLDTYKKIYGSSFNGKKFKITDITKNLKSVKVKAIEVT